MQVIPFLDVREREGKPASFSEAFVLYIKDNGKMSIYCPFTGRFYPAGRQKQVGGGQPQPAAAAAQPRSMPGQEWGPNNPPGDPDPPRGNYGHFPDSDDDTPF